MAKLFLPLLMTLTTLTAANAQVQPLAKPAEASSTLRLEVALAAIKQSGEEGRRVYTHLYTDEARAAAHAADERAALGRSLGPLDGRIVSLKDLLDVRGEPTTAGSKLLRKAPVAIEDAPVVMRLRQAGAVIIGKTNMTEFAFTGVGVNPHYGTPGNAHDAKRIPGGSSSGAGVSVARGMAEIAIGSDTGGSIRIPAALNGVVGFKPSIGRVPVAGAYPLSFTLDTIGPLATTVADVAIADAVMAGDDVRPLPVRHVSGLRLAVPRGLLFTKIDDQVLSAFNKSLATLQTAGARVTDESLDDLMSAPFSLQEKGTLIAAEAAFIHRKGVSSHPELYDPVVLSRIQRGQTMDAASYVAVQQERIVLMQRLDQALAGFDAIVLPTVALLPPLISDVQDQEAFMRVNALLLRNTSVFNFYDLPALSLPLARPGQLPVGLMIVGRRGTDRELLAIGAALEASLR